MDLSKLSNNSVDELYGDIDDMYISQSNVTESDITVTSTTLSEVLPSTLPLPSSSNVTTDSDTVTMRNGETDEISQDLNDVDLDLYDETIGEEQQYKNDTYNELRDKVDFLVAKLTELEAENNILHKKTSKTEQEYVAAKRNIASLLLTTKGELQRKDREIADLRKRLSVSPFQHKKKTRVSNLQSSFSDLDSFSMSGPDKASTPIKTKKPSVISNSKRSDLTDREYVSSSDGERKSSSLKRRDEKSRRRAHSPYSSRSESEDTHKIDRKLIDSSDYSISSISKRSNSSMNDNSALIDSKKSGDNKKSDRNNEKRDGHTRVPSRLARSDKNYDSSKEEKSRHRHGSSPSSRVPARSDRLDKNGGSSKEEKSRHRHGSSPSRHASSSSRSRKKVSSDDQDRRKDSHSPTERRSRKNDSCSPTDLRSKLRGGEVRVSNKSKDTSPHSRSKHRSGDSKKRSSMIAEAQSKRSESEKSELTISKENLKNSKLSKAFNDDDSDADSDADSQNDLSEGELSDSSDETSNMESENCDKRHSLVGSVKSNVQVVSRNDSEGKSKHSSRSETRSEHSRKRSGESRKYTEEVDKVLDKSRDSESKSKPAVLDLREKLRQKQLKDNERKDTELNDVAKTKEKGEICRTKDNSREVNEITEVSRTKEHREIISYHENDQLSKNTDVLDLFDSEALENDLEYDTFELFETKTELKSSKAKNTELKEKQNSAAIDKSKSEPGSKERKKSGPNIKDSLKEDAEFLKSLRSNVSKQSKPGKQMLLDDMEFLHKIKSSVRNESASSLSKTQTSSVSKTVKHVEKEITAGDKNCEKSATVNEKVENSNSLEGIDNVMKVKDHSVKGDIKNDDEKKVDDNFDMYEDYVCNVEIGEAPGEDETPKDIATETHTGNLGSKTHPAILENKPPTETHAENVENKTHVENVKTKTLAEDVESNKLTGKKATEMCSENIDSESHTGNKDIETHLKNMETEKHTENLKTVTHSENLGSEKHHESINPDSEVTAICDNLKDKIGQCDSEEVSKSTSLSAIEKAKLSPNCGVANCSIKMRHIHPKQSISPPVGHTNDKLVPSNKSTDNSSKSLWNQSIDMKADIPELCDKSKSKTIPAKRYQSHKQDNNLPVSETLVSQVDKGAELTPTNVASPTHKDGAQTEASNESDSIQTVEKVRENVDENLNKSSEAVKVIEPVDKMDDVNANHVNETETKTINEPKLVDESIDNESVGSFGSNIMSEKTGSWQTTDSSDSDDDSCISSSDDSSGESSSDGDYSDTESTGDENDFNELSGVNESEHERISVNNDKESVTIPDNASAKPTTIGNIDKNSKEVKQIEPETEIKSSNVECESTETLVTGKHDVSKNNDAETLLDVPRSIKNHSENTSVSDKNELPASENVSEANQICSKIKDFSKKRNNGDSDVPNSEQNESNLVTPSNDDSSMNVSCGSNTSRSNMLQNLLKCFEKEFEHLKPEGINIEESIHSEKGTSKGGNNEADANAVHDEIKGIENIDSVDASHEASNEKVISEDTCDVNMEVDNPGDIEDKTDLPEDKIDTDKVNGVVEKIDRDRVIDVQTKNDKNTAIKLLYVSGKNEVKGLKDKNGKNEIKRLDDKSVKNKVNGLEDEINKVEIKGMGEKSSQSEIRDIEDESGKNVIQSIEKGNNTSKVDNVNNESDKLSDLSMSDSYSDSSGSESDSSYSSHSTDCSTCSSHPSSCSTCSDSSYCSTCSGSSSDSDSNSDDDSNDDDDTDFDKVTGEQISNENHVKSTSVQNSGKDLLKSGKEVVCDNVKTAVCKESENTEHESERKRSPTHSNNSSMPDKVVKSPSHASNTKSVSQDRNKRQCKKSSKPQSVKPFETATTKPSETPAVKPSETPAVKPSETQKVKPSKTLAIKPSETRIVRSSESLVVSGGRSNKKVNAACSEKNKETANKTQYKPVLHSPLEHLSTSSNVSPIQSNPYLVCDEQLNFSISPAKDEVLASTKKKSNKKPTPKSRRKHVSGSPEIILTVTPNKSKPNTNVDIPNLGKISSLDDGKAVIRKCKKIDFEKSDENDEEISDLSDDKDSENDASDNEIDEAEPLSSQNDKLRNRGNRHSNMNVNDKLNNERKDECSNDSLLTFSPLKTNLPHSDDKSSSGARKSSHDARKVRSNTARKQTSEKNSASSTTNVEKFGEQILRRSPRKACNISSKTDLMSPKNKQKVITSDSEETTNNTEMFWKSLSQNKHQRIGKKCYENSSESKSKKSLPRPLDASVNKKHSKNDSSTDDLRLKSKSGSDQSSSRSRRTRNSSSKPCKNVEESSSTVKKSNSCESDSKTSCVNLSSVNVNICKKVDCNNDCSSNKNCNVQSKPMNNKNTAECKISKDRKTMEENSNQQLFKVVESIDNKTQKVCSRIKYTSTELTSPVKRFIIPKKNSSKRKASTSPPLDKKMPRKPLQLMSPVKSPPSISLKRTSDGLWSKIPAKTLLQVSEVFSSSSSEDSSEGSSIVDALFGKDSPEKVPRGGNSKSTNEKNTKGDNSKSISENGTKRGNSESISEKVTKGDDSKSIKEKVTKGDNSKSINEKVTKGDNFKSMNEKVTKGVNFKSSNEENQCKIKESRSSEKLVKDNDKSKCVNSNNDKLKLVNSANTLTKQVNSKTDSSKEVHLTKGKTKLVKLSNDKIKDFNSKTENVKQVNSNEKIKQVDLRSEKNKSVNSKTDENKDLSTDDKMKLIADRLKAAHVTLDKMKELKSSSSNIGNKTKPTNTSLVLDLDEHTMDRIDYEDVLCLDECANEFDNDTSDVTSVITSEITSDNNSDDDIEDGEICAESKSDDENKELTAKSKGVALKEKSVDSNVKSDSEDKGKAYVFDKLLSDAKRIERRRRKRSRDRRSPVYRSRDRRRDPRRSRSPIDSRRRSRLEYDRDRKFSSRDRNDSRDRRVRTPLKRRRSGSRHRDSDSSRSKRRNTSSRL